MAENSKIEWTDHAFNPWVGYFFRGDVIMRRIGKKVAGRLLGGREWDEFPNAVQQERNR